MTHRGAGPNIKPNADGWPQFQLLRHCHKQVPLSPVNMWKRALCLAVSTLFDRVCGYKRVINISLCNRDEIFCMCIYQDNTFAQKYTRAAFSLLILLYDSVFD